MTEWFHGALLAGIVVGMVITTVQLHRLDRRKREVAAIEARLRTSKVSSWHMEMHIDTKAGRRKMLLEIEAPEHLGKLDKAAFEEPEPECANATDNAYRYELQAKNDRQRVEEARDCATCYSRCCRDCAHFGEPEPERNGYGACFARGLYGLPMPDYPAGTCPHFRPVDPAA